jgi:hypothetical protein
LSYFTLTLLLSHRGRGNDLPPFRTARPDVIASEANAERGNLRPPQPYEIASADAVSLAMTGVRLLCTPDKSGDHGFELPVSEYFSVLISRLDS